MLQLSYNRLNLFFALVLHIFILILPYFGTFYYSTHLSNFVILSFHKPISIITNIGVEIGKNCHIQHFLKLHGNNNNSLINEN